MEGEKQDKKIVVHPSAVVASDVKLQQDVLIGPYCVVEKGSSIGRGTKLIANVYVGKNVKIGAGNLIYPTSSVGCPPQILGFNLQKHNGGLEIGDNNVIREQATIHPSMREGHLTKVGNNNLIMVGVHIGHDCVIEDSIVLSNYVQISGHCKIETGVWFSGVVLVHQFITIGRWSYAAGMAGINHDIPPFVIVSGHYPPRIRGVNKRGLKRAGLNQQQQNNIYEAYKKLYRNDRPLLENARNLAAQDGLDENVRAMVNAILKSSEHRFGRYLETLRQ